MHNKTYIDAAYNDTNEAVMRLYGTIGSKVDGDLFAQELASLDSAGYNIINVRVNSSGGDVFQGMSIVSAIMSMSTPVYVHIDGIAASMAAVIAAAADTVHMMDFSKMMVHDPYFSGPGSDKCTPKMKKMLSRLTDMLRQLLSRRGIDEPEMERLMKEETWFSADEAKAVGLCDEITTSLKSEYLNMAPLQLVAAVEAEYELINNKNQKQMKIVATTLGLPENAAEADVLAAVTKLKENHSAEIATLKSEKQAAQDKLAAMETAQKEAEKAEALSLVSEAIQAGKISAALKDEYMESFADNFERTKKLLGAVTGRKKLSDLVEGSDGSKYANLSWDDLDKQGLLAELKKNDPDMYAKKYADMSATLNVARK